MQNDWKDGRNDDKHDSVRGVCNVLTFTGCCSITSMGFPAIFGIVSWFCRILYCIGLSLFVHVE